LEDEKELGQDQPTVPWRAALLASSSTAKSSCFLDTAFPFSFPSVGVSWPDDDLEQVCTDAFILLVVQFHATVHPFG